MCSILLVTFLSTDKHLLTAREIKNMEDIRKAITSRTPLSDYIKHKIKMLKEDFRIKLSFEDIAKLKACTSEIQADRIAHDILMAKL